MSTPDNRAGTITEGRNTLTVLSVREAIRLALQEELRRDDKVFVIGEQVGTGSAFKVTDGLLAEFGKGRIVDTPLSESAITGCAVGAAMMGFKPIAEIMFADFIVLAMDHLVNSAAKLRYQHDGAMDVSLVLRMPLGGGATMGAHHSQCVESWVLNVPGLKIVTHSNPHDAKGLLKSCIRDRNPVVFLEHKLLYNEKGEVPEGEYTVPLGKAKVVSPGEDVSIISYSYMVKKSLAAAAVLAEHGIKAEVVDVRTIRPLDVETLAESVKKTGKAVVVHEAPVIGSAGAEIVAQIHKEAFDYLDAPIERVGALETPVPFSSTLEQAYLPNERKIVEAVARLLNQEAAFAATAR
jgi:pyruvate/2-oxoglutarate/acetoin dehydrogenase E1 component